MRIDEVVKTRMQDIFSGKARVSGPVTEDAILGAERELGLEFPPSYRAFLTLFGAASLRSVYIHGLPRRSDDEDEIPEFSDVSRDTIDLRRGPYGGPPLPFHLIYVGSDGGGLHFYIDTSKRSDDGDSPVLVSGGGVPMQMFATNFLEYLIKLNEREDPYMELVYGDGPYLDEPAQPSKARPSSDLIHASIGDPPPSGRTVQWLRLVPDPCPPDLPLLAQHVAVDPSTREVFVYAPSAGLDAVEQVEAAAGPGGFFGSPFGEGETRHAYVSTDYLIAKYPGLPSAEEMPSLKRVVLAAYDRDDEDMSDDKIAIAIENYVDNYYGPNSPERVAAVERELGLTLPRDYRVFLGRFGAAVCNGHMIAGLPDTRNSGDEPPFWSHVVDASETMWPNRAGIGVERHLISITDNGGDVHYYLDTSAMDDKGECPVIALGPGYLGVVVGSTFLEFLQKLAATDGEPLPDPVD